MTDDDTNTISFPAILTKSNIYFGWNGEEVSVEVTFRDMIKTAEEKNRLIGYLRKIFQERLDVEITLIEHRKE